PAWTTNDIDDPQSLDVRVYYHRDLTADDAEAGARLLGARILAAAPFFERLTLTVSPRELKQLARQDWVLFVEPISAPPRAHNNSTSGQLIRVTDIQAAPFLLSGRDLALGIWDQGAVAAHPDFGTRLTLVERGTVSSHATHVAGTMAGSGESDPRLKGMATGARIFSWNFNGDVASEMAAGVDQNGIVLSQNSWGFAISEELNNCGDYGLYGGDERDADKLVREKRLNLIFSAGNDRDEPICSILPRTGYYTIGRPATAKNVITVGAVDAERAMSTFSGAGPTRDGRIKPDIVAMGVGVRSPVNTFSSQISNGTSMSAPAISGLAALLIERYRDRVEPQNPAPALVKAVLLNTARDLGNPGPDYVYGYGLADGVEAVRVLDNRLFASGTLANDATRDHRIEVASGSHLRVMLAYSDPEGPLNAASAVVNHLDIVLKSPDGVEYLPLGLDPSKPSADAAPKAGLRDNVKQIVVRQPASGAWTLTVRGVEVPQGEQEYFITWTTAEIADPPCKATVAPTTLLVGEKENTAIVNVTQANQCEPWKPTGQPDWITVPEGDRTGSQTVKLGVKEHASPGPRRAAVTIAGSTVRLIQNSPCRTAPIAFGQSVREFISGEDCYLDVTDLTWAKYFTFDGVQGQRVAITLRSSAFDAYLFLLGPGRGLIQLNDDGAGGTNSRIPAFDGYLILPQTGRYTIIVTTFDPEEFGEFTLDLEEGAAVPGQPGLREPTRVSACPALFDGVLNAESTRAGRRGDLFPTDVYLFTGRAGTEVAIEIPEAGFDSFLYLIGPNNRILATANDPASSGKARLIATLNQTGLWQLEVSSFAPFQSGPYKLTFEGCAAAQ
ncbi:MAG: S8 family serine peptidase, partial [Bryobacter sp.]|nr:S8 family serine peptidase [Bryobacter sp.]